MNNEKQLKKNLENKQWQAREEYAKNKALLSESKVQEKANDYLSKKEDTDQLNESVIKDTYGKKKSE